MIDQSEMRYSVECVIRSIEEGNNNQLAMPVLSYLTWSQHWCLTDLRDIDRQARKIVCESGGKHPLGLKATVKGSGRTWNEIGRGREQND